MYFSGKSYFKGNREITTISEKRIDTQRLKPKSRKKGKLTRKSKSKNKFNFTKLKKQLGNDMVIKLLLRLVEGKAGARPVGRPPQQTEIIKKPRGMKLAKGSGLPAREKQKLEKKKQGETEQQFFKRVEDYVFENNPSMIFLSQLLQQDRQRAEAIIREQIAELRNQPVDITSSTTRTGEIEPAFAIDLIRQLRVAGFGNSKEDLKARRDIVKKAQKEYKERTGDELRSSDEERFIDLANTKGKENRERLSTKLQFDFAEAGKPRKKAKERVVSTETTTTLGELGGEALSSAESSLISGLSGGEESVSKYLDRFNTGQGFGFRGGRRTPLNPLDRGGYSEEEEKLRLASQLQPTPAPSPIPAPAGVGRPRFETLGIKTKAQLKAEEKRQQQQQQQQQQPQGQQKSKISVIKRQSGESSGGESSGGESSSVYSYQPNPQFGSQIRDDESGAESGAESGSESGLSYVAESFTTQESSAESDISKGERTLPVEELEERLRTAQRERRFNPYQSSDTGEIELTSTEPTGKVGSKGVARTPKGIETLQQTEVEKGLNTISKEASRAGLGVLERISSGTKSILKAGQTAVNVASQYQTAQQKADESRKYELEKAPLGRRGFLPDEPLSKEEWEKSGEFQDLMFRRASGDVSEGEFSSEGEQAFKGYSTAGSGAEEFEDYFGKQQPEQQATLFTETLPTSEAETLPTSESEAEYSESEREIDFEKFKSLSENDQKKVITRLQGQVKYSDKQLSEEAKAKELYKSFLDTDEETQAQEVIEFNKKQRELVERQSVSGLPQDKELSQLNQELLGIEDFTIPKQYQKPKKVKKTTSLVKQQIEVLEQQIDDLQLTLGQGASTGGMALQAEGRTEEDIKTEIQQLEIERDIKLQELEKIEKKQEKRKQTLTQPEPETDEDTGKFLEEQKTIAQKEQTLTRRAKEFLPKLEVKYNTLLRKHTEQSANIGESLSKEEKQAKQSAELFDFRGEIEDEIYKLNQSTPAEEKLLNQAVRADIAIKLLDDPYNPQLIKYEETYGDLNEYTGIIPEQMNAKQVKAQLEEQRKRFYEANKRLREFEADRSKALEGVEALEAKSRKKQSEIYGGEVKKPFRIEANIEGSKIRPENWKEYESKVLEYFVSQNKLTEEQRQQIINSDTKKRKEIVNKLKKVGKYRREWLLPKEGGEYEKWWKSYVETSLSQINPQTAGRKPRTEEQKAEGGSAFKREFDEYLENRLEGLTDQQKASVISVIEEAKSKNSNISNLFSGESQGKGQKQSAFKNLEKQISKALLTSGEGQSKSRKSPILEQRNLETFVGDIEGDDIKYFLKKNKMIIFQGVSGVSTISIKTIKGDVGSIYRLIDTNTNKQYKLKIISKNKYRLEEDVEKNDSLKSSKEKVLMTFD